jgi:hypothetical protein
MYTIIVPGIGRYTFQTREGARTFARRHPGSVASFTLPSHPSHPWKIQSTDRDATRRHECVIPKHARMVRA